LKTNEPVLIQIGTSSLRVKCRKRSTFGGQKVKGQGHMEVMWISICTKEFVLTLFNTLFPRCMLC